MGGPLAAAGTIPGVVERAAASSYAGRPALVDESGTGTITFAELLELVRSAAGALIEAGVGAGDRVALWAPNTPEWAMASLAVLFAGGSVVPINTRYTAVEAAALVSRADCRVVLARANWGTEPGREAAAMPDRTRSCHSEPRPPGLTLVGGVRPGVGSSIAALRTRGWPGCTPGDVSHVQYTSGTTGVPKGAMLRHGAMVDTTASWAGGRPGSTGGPLPGGQPVLAHRRPQDRTAGVPAGGRDDGPGGPPRSRRLRADRGRSEVTVVQGPRPCFTR